MIQEIKEIQQILQLKFRLRMTWFDTRLDFFNIKLDENMNVISIDELNKIWLPVVVFDNTEKGQRTISDDESFATINRMSNFKDTIVHKTTSPMQNQKLQAEYVS